MDAIILVDLQYDFMPGGALAVPEGDAVVPIANRLIKQFETVIATQDWHPPEHVSFASNHADRRPGEIITVDGRDQILWPVHCVQGSPGANLHRELDTARITKIIQKGTNPRIDSYSGFFDNARAQSTDLNDELKSRGIRRIIVLGLATDYCVKFTVLDALSLGYEATLVLDGCRGVELREGDIRHAVADMESAGARISNSAELIQEFAGR